MKIFFDTNIWIAALLNSRTCREIVKHCWSKQEVLISETVMNEVHKVLTKKLGYTEKEINKAFSFVTKYSYFVDEAPLISPICRDADDDRILAAASGGNASCIITGDNDLLVIRVFNGIPILKPSEFWKFEDQYGSSYLAEGRAEYFVEKKRAKAFAYSK